jgi:hypothetical protein
MKILIKRVLGEDFFYNNIKEIRQSVISCKTFLDLGCGSESPYLKYLHKEGNNAIGVDLYADVQPMGYKEIIRKDVLQFIQTLPDNSFDAVTAFDIVEHFHKHDAVMLISEMKRVASKVVVVVTPNGFWPGMLSGPGMEHLCGFSTTELKEAHFKLYGAGGLSFLRSKAHSFLRGFNSLSTLKFQLFLFNFSQIFAKRLPDMAYGVCAIYTKGRE